MITGLAYDIGMNNGDDAEYLLRCGHRVIAVEADAVLCEQTKRRFENYISDGMLIVLNVGIGAEAGQFTFWINETTPEHSSFDRGMASKHGGSVIAREVQAVTFEQILSEYGVPELLKIDIEGADQLCLSALQRTDLPRYVSVEAHSLIPAFQLLQLGFSKFKLVNQFFHNIPASALASHSPVRRAFAEWSSHSEIGQTISRRGRKLGRRLFPGRAGGTYADTVAKFPKGAFPFGSSGPIGDESPGDWREFNAVVYDWLHIQNGFPMRSNLARPGWFDFHAIRDC